jgi:formylglycine-generating enzyme required for sulfatase activity
LTVTSELGVGFGAEQFALIPAGTFQMGDMTGHGALDELPVHLVFITQAFHMQKTEVTQGQWKAVMGSNPSYDPGCGDTCPVEQVSWNDIQTFLSVLNTIDPGKNYRLPTEAEWEYAARAGTTGDYGGTGVLDEMGWYVGNSGGQLHPVAQKLPNAWGLFDMHGNVFEFVQDWYQHGYYSVSPMVDPPGPSTGSRRVERGGGWGGDTGVTRSARRFSLDPSEVHKSGGFRIVRNP